MKLMNTFLEHTEMLLNDISVVTPSFFILERHEQQITELENAVNSENMDSSKKVQDLIATKHFADQNLLPVCGDIEWQTLSSRPEV